MPAVVPLCFVLKVTKRSWRIPEIAGVVFIVPSLGPRLSWVRSSTLPIELLDMDETNVVWKWDYNVLILVENLRNRTWGTISNRALMEDRLLQVV